MFVLIFAFSGFVSDAQCLAPTELLLWVFFFFFAKRRWILLTGYNLLSQGVQELRAKTCAPQ